MILAKKALSVAALGIATTIVFSATANAKSKTVKDERKCMHGDHAACCRALKGKPLSATRPIDKDYFEIAAIVDAIIRYETVTVTRENREG